MANTNTPTGAKPRNASTALVKIWTVTATATLSAGDTVYLDSAGTVSDTASQYVVGVAVEGIIDTDGYTVNTTAGAGDTIKVYDDQSEIYIMQISTYAITAPYTTCIDTACFDTAGTQGVQYIDAAASTQDTWKILGLATEEDSGKASALGAYAKVQCQINPNVHYRTKIS